MEKTIAEIAEVIGAEVEGDPQLKIYGVRGMAEAGDGDLTFLSDRKNFTSIEKSRASAAIVFSDSPKSQKTLLKVEKPALSLAVALHLFQLDAIPHPRGIHPTALVGKGVSLGKDIALGPYTVIGDGCKIGDRTILYGGVHVGPGTEIGSDGIIYSNVTLREKIRIGHRVILHPGVVIGADGFGFTAAEDGFRKIPQVGTVRIEDDVEIGANSCVDRAALETTVIGKGTKIDNLVQIGHNCVVGKACILAGMAGLAGSVRLGDQVVLGGQVGVRDHLTLADGVRVGGKAAVVTDLAERGDYLGIPAVPMVEFMTGKNYLNRLPELFEELEKIKKKLGL